MSRGTLSRCIQSKEIQRHSNAIKLALIEENKNVELQFFISMLDSASIDDDSFFKGMYNTVHIDDKWFYLNEKSSFTWSLMKKIQFSLVKVKITFQKSCF